MLDDRVILYDDSCPMCRLYTQAFVRAGALKPENRVAFSAGMMAPPANLDPDRARHEIPLIDLRTGEVVYGLDALFLVVGHRWPVLRPLLRRPATRAALYPLYQFITYNRRVIAGCAPPAAGFDCAPDFSPRHRAQYLAFAALLALTLAVAVGVRLSAAEQAGLLTGFAGGFALLAARAAAITDDSVSGWERRGHAATSLLVYCLLASPVTWLPPFAALLAGVLGVAFTVTLLDARRRERTLRVLNARARSAIQKL